MIKQENTTMSLHEKCGSMKINLIPKELLERLRQRQNDRSVFKYRIDENDWLDTILMLLGGIAVISLSIYLLRKTGLECDLENYPIETLMPFLAVLAIWLVETMLRRLWLRWHNPLKHQTYITTAYLVEITYDRVNFYPLELIEKIQIDHIYISSRRGEHYKTSYITINFKDGNSFSYSRRNKAMPDRVSAKIDDMKNYFFRKMEENDIQWLDDMDDFKLYYDNLDSFKKMMFIGLRKIGLISSFLVQT